MSEERKPRWGTKQSGKTTTKNKVGRPPEAVPDDIAEQIIEWISLGQTLRDFCRQEGMPSYRAVYRWMAKNEEFASRFAQARELGQDFIAEECLEIADDASNDWMEKIDKDGMAVGWQLNGDHVQRSKLRIETRLKLLAKWNPKKYGDRVGVDHQGGVQLNVVTGVPEE